MSLNRDLDADFKDQVFQYRADICPQSRSKRKTKGRAISKILLSSTLTMSTYTTYSFVFTKQNIDYQAIKPAQLRAQIAIKEKISNGAAKNAIGTAGKVKWAIEVIDRRVTS